MRKMINATQTRLAIRVVFASQLERKMNYAVLIIEFCITLRLSSLQNNLQ